VHARAYTLIFLLRRSHRNGLDRDGRAELLTAMNNAIARIEAAVRRRVDACHLEWR
jgi:hypothetical protein